MSAYISHARRALVSSAGSKRAFMTVLSSSNHSIIQTAAAPQISARGHIPTVPMRKLSAAENEKGVTTAVNDDQLGLSYKERKDAAKKRRRETWVRKQQRLERLKTRRDNSPKDVLKSKFRSWWDKEMNYHSTLCQQAKKENRPWRIRVAAMVERLPVVTPDTEEWEGEYFALRDYFWTYGKVYPEETGFMPPEKPEDHIVPTDEELLAGLPFIPAPRETEADATGDVKTRDRQLKTRVYLAVKSDAEENMSGPRWTLPSTIPCADETLLQAAERAVSENIGRDLSLWCPSNAPMTVNFRVYSKNLPEDFRKNYYGEKIFYYRVQYDQGDVDERTLNVEDYAWLTREEITERVEKERGKHQAKFYHYML